MKQVILEKARFGDDVYQDRSGRYFQGNPSWIGGHFDKPMYKGFYRDLKIYNPNPLYISEENIQEKSLAESLLELQTKYPGYKNNSKISKEVSLEFLHQQLDKIMNV